MILMLTSVFLSFAVLNMPGYAAKAQEGRTESQKEEKEELTLYAQSAVLMDAVSGRVLYGKNEHTVRPMASTTKIMTCIVALEHGNMDDVVTASQNAAGQPKVHLGVRKGQTFKMGDLLYSLMLESHNDSAVMIAEHIGGSVEGFAALMNQKARDLGCPYTYFITPNGLDASVVLEDGVERMHSTTAEDLGRIMRYCILESPKKEEFLKITRTQNYFFSDAEGKGSFSCVNHNAFLSMMEGALSGKTGFTGGAGYSYIGALESGDRIYIVALLGCGWPPHKTYKWSDTRKLFQFGMDNYQYRDVFKEPRLEPITVENAVPESETAGGEVQIPLSLYLEGDDRSLKLLMRSGEKVEVKTDLPTRLDAPVEKGDTVGTLTYLLEGKIVKTYLITADRSVKRISLSWCVKRIADLWMQMPGFDL